jgi:hypothetical protein
VLGEIITYRETCILFRQNVSELDSYLVRIKYRKRDIRFGTWNVRSLYRAGSLTAAARELAIYKFYLVGVQEVRGGQRGYSKCMGL